MRGRGLLCICSLLCGLVWGCGVEIGGSEGPGGGGGGGGGAWSSPTLLQGASSNVSEDDPTLSTSMFELFFSYEDASDRNNKHLYSMVRQTSGAWNTPQALPFNERGSVDQTPRLSSDELTLYFASDRDRSTRGLDIWRVSRPTVGGSWGAPERLAELDDPNQDDKWFAPCAGGRYLMISERGQVGDDVYEGVLGNGEPDLVPELTSMRGETGPFLSPDCLTLHFASARSGQNRMYTSRRGSIGDRWSEPVEIEDFEALGGNQEDPWLSPDGRTFVFVSDVAGSKDVYLTTR